MIEKETECRAKVAELLRTRWRGFVVLCLEERRGGQSGNPDLFVAGYGKVSCWEFKYADPDFESQGMQELTMLRLAAANHGRYIIFEDHNGLQSTRIIHPRDLKEWRSIAPNRPGLDFKWVAEQIAGQHIRS